jgi:hypothetical protein
MSVHSRSSRHHFRHHITLAHMERLKNWHMAQRGAHPAEREIWEAVLTLWVMGWMGWFPAYAFEAHWAYPLCLLGVLAPRLYVGWREHAHEAQRLRCDWLDLVC